MILCKKILLGLFISISVNIVYCQGTANPCGQNPEYRQFDFFIGEWLVTGKNNQKAGESKISRILDSCIILEEWTGLGNYAGKSFNTYNVGKKQWQQTWVDNKGGSIEFLRGEAVENKMTFYADDNIDQKGNHFKRRLTFYKLNEKEVRQHGELFDEQQKAWTTEYDLKYIRK